MIKNVIPVDVIVKSDVARIQLGETYVEPGTNHKFRFVKMAEAVTKGQVVGHAIQDANLDTVISTGAFAAEEKVITLAPLAVDVFAGDLVGKKLFLSGGTGAGYTYEITANKEALIGADIEITLGKESVSNLPGLVEAIDGTTGGAIIEARYNDCIVMPLGGGTNVAGIANVEVTADDITNGNVYMWLQVAGDAEVVWDAALVATPFGGQVNASTTVDGAFSATATFINPIGLISAVAGTQDFLLIELAIS